jgi:uncharacterized membrane protein YfcA
MAVLADTRARGAVTKTLGGWRHWRKGTVDLGVSMWLAAGSVPGALVGVWLLDRLWVAGFAHWLSGNVDVALMGTILIGSLPGVWIGTQLVGHVSANALRPVLGCVLLGSALGVLTKAGVAVAPAALVGVPLAVGLAAYVLLRTRAATASPEPEVVPA